MKYGISSLRRRLVLARTHLVLDRLGVQFCIEWHVARVDKKPLPEWRTFTRRAYQAGIMVPNVISLIHYLDSCREKDEDPAPDKLRMMLAPGLPPTSEPRTRFPPDEIHPGAFTPGCVSSVDGSGAVSPSPYLKYIVLTLMRGS